MPELPEHLVGTVIAMADDLEIEETDAGEIVYTCSLLGMHREHPLRLEVHLWVRDDAVAIEAAFPVEDIDLDRIDARTSPDPIVEYDVVPPSGEDESAVEAGADGSDDAERELALFVVRAVETLDGLTVNGLRTALGIVRDEFSRLATLAVIQLIHLPLEDPELMLKCREVERLKPTEPQLALDIAAEARALAFDGGDDWVAALLDTVRVELLTDLGYVNEALLLGEATWARLGEPVTSRSLLQALALAQLRGGKAESALELLASGLDAAVSDEDRALLHGNRGSLLGQLGHHARAIDDFEVALSYPDLDRESRELFRRHLANLRSGISGPEPAPLTGDVLDDVDNVLDEIASLTQPRDSRDLLQRLHRSLELLDGLRSKWDRFGPAQQLRWLVARAVLSRMMEGVDEARSWAMQAQHLAEQTGQTQMIMPIAELLPDSARWAGEDRLLLGPLRRAMHLTNRAKEEFQAGVLSGDLGSERQTLVFGLIDDALDAIDAERFEQTSVADRIGWAESVTMLYEFALIAAEMCDRADVFGDVLERTRAQGTPDLTVGARATPFESGAERLRSTERERGRLPVFAPSRAKVDPAACRSGEITIAKLAESVAGGPAWYWNTYGQGDCLYRLLREANGEMHTLVVPNLNRTVRAISAKLVSVGTTDRSQHPLVGLSPEQLDEQLRPLADAIIPEALRDALLDAAGRRQPIRLVWAPSPGLASIPIALLPIGSGFHVLDGGIISYAPPTSMVLSAGSTRPPVRPLPFVAAVTFDEPGAPVLGPSGIDVAPAAALGTSELMRFGLAARLATAASIRKQWESNPAALGLYYGHVESPGGGPLTGGLLVRRGRPNEMISASDLLLSEPLGVPTRMVVAGCSSMTASSVGSGEWWGIAAGLLHQGARQVIGSMWDLIHGSSMVQFVAELCDELRVRPDAAAALRDVQLAWKRRWRAAANSGSTETPRLVPYIWGGFTLTGIAD